MARKQSVLTSNVSTVSAANAASQALPVKKEKGQKKGKKVQASLAEVSGVVVNKRTRPPSAYSLYVKQHMTDDDIKALPHSQRFQAIATKYKSAKK